MQIFPKSLNNYLKDKQNQVWNAQNARKVRENIKIFYSTV